jgi:hypothetical protein
VKCGVAWGSSSPPGKDRSPATDPTSTSHFLFLPPVRYSIAKYTTEFIAYSRRMRTAANCCGPELLFKLDGPDHQSEPIARPILLHDDIAHSDRRPKTEDGTAGQAASTTITTIMESTSPAAHGSTTSETPASANRSSGHRCFVCSRTYERADHLNRHLKSRKLPLRMWIVLF